MEKHSRKPTCVLMLLFIFGFCCSTTIAECTSEQFTCGNSECIPLGYRCDRDNDCKDNTDEQDCNPCDQLDEGETMSVWYSHFGRYISPRRGKLNEGTNVLLRCIGADSVLISSCQHGSWNPNPQAFHCDIPDPRYIGCFHTPKHLYEIVLTGTKEQCIQQCIEYNNGTAVVGFSYKFSGRLEMVCYCAFNLDISEIKLHQQQDESCEHFNVELFHAECQPGFWGVMGSICSNKCSGNCLNSKCNIHTGTCEDDGEPDPDPTATTNFQGYAIGIVVLILALFIVVIITFIVAVKRRKAKKEVNNKCNKGNPNMIQQVTATTHDIQDRLYEDVVEMRLCQQNSANEKIIEKQKKKNEEESFIYDDTAIPVYVNQTEFPMEQTVEEEIYEVIPECGLNPENLSAEKMYEAVNKEDIPINEPKIYCALKK